MYVLPEVVSLSTTEWMILTRPCDVMSSGTMGSVIREKRQKRSEIADVQSGLASGGDCEATYAEMDNDFPKVSVCVLGGKQLASIKSKKC